MATEREHLHLFPDTIPTVQIGIVVNALRRVDDGKTLRDKLEAAWWVLGYGLSFIPDQHPPALESARMSEEDAAAKLDELNEALKSGRQASAVGAFPWQLVLPLIIKLIERLIGA